MRLQRPIYPLKPIEKISLRVVTNDMPEGSQVEVTDMQIQPGELATGVTVNPREVGTKVGSRQWRNGVVHGGMEVIALANIDRATPTRVEVSNVHGEVQVGTYRFGNLAGGRAWADGRQHRANQGWGHVPVITERSDLYLRTKMEGRAHVTIEWDDREPGELQT